MLQLPFSLALFFSADMPMMTRGVGGAEAAGGAAVFYLSREITSSFQASSCCMKYFCRNAERNIAETLNAAVGLLLQLEFESWFHRSKADRFRRALGL